MNVLVVYAPRPCCVRAQSAIAARPGLIVCAPRALSCQLCLYNRALAVASPCRDIEPYVATQEAPTSNTLCRNIEKLCRDTGSTLRVILCCDTEDSVTIINPFVTVQVYHDREFSVATESPYCARAYVVRICLSCVPSSVMGDIASLLRLGSPLLRHNFSLFWPTLSRPKNALSWPNFSLPWPILS